MNSEPSSLEAVLRELQAAALEETLLLRLEAAAEGSLTQLSQDEIRFEAFLHEVSASRLPNEFLADLASIVREVPFPVNEKIVLFPKGNASTKPHRSMPKWGAAAAVALFASVSALMMPASKPVATASIYDPAASPNSNKVKAENFVPASFDRGLSEVRDEGVIWKSKNQPQSVVRVVYKDIITLKDEQGRTIQVEQPRIEYLLVPSKTD